MSSIEDALPLSRRPSALAALSRLIFAPRFWIYACCTLAALLTSHHLGKDMEWDTLNYHLYAGFSALHDRFGQDYFAAGAQGYFNPYIFVPFYLLATSGLTASEVASILAVVQSAILWLTYELAVALAPGEQPRARVALGICAAVFAFANPVLITQFGTSFADILTAELVLAGWLSLIAAVRGPGTMRIVAAALLLGCACALKPTNAVHAVSAGALLLFLPVDWWSKLRSAAIFVAVGALAAVAVCAPWSLRLQEHFGNPVFPLLNNLFQSPQYTTGRMLDYRFIPPSFGAALRLPFTMIAPRGMIQVEWAAPDLRYALLLVLGVLAIVIWGWRRLRGAHAGHVGPGDDSSRRLLAALACGFVVDWILWLMASGNGRYFIPMACVAGVLATVLAFRLWLRSPRLLSWVLAAALGVQFLQLHLGTEYHAALPWPDGPWFQVSVPTTQATHDALYFTIGEQSDSFLAPYLAPGSGLINLEGGYNLGAAGANGKHIEALISRFSPHLWVLVRDLHIDAGKNDDFPGLVNANDALEPFGLRIDTSRCARIVVTDTTSPPIGFSRSGPSKVRSSEANVGHFITCHLVTQTTRDPALVAGERAANIALDHLEDACPALLQPRRPVTYVLGDAAHGLVWARQYSNTDMAVWVAPDGWLHFQRLIGGGQEGYAGPEAAWERAPVPVACGRGSQGYYLRRLSLH
jgi:hypothetical protein